MITIEDKIRYSKAKLRNIIYYRLEIEPTLEDRFRCQFMGILRSYRKEVLNIMKELDINDSRRSWFASISNIINPKIKSDECLSTILKLKKFIDE